jgi:NADH-quinone oxidoreductase subunit J
LRSEDAPGGTWQRPLAVTLGVALVVLAALVLMGGAPSALAAPTGAPVVDSSPLVIGKELSGTYLFPFEVVSVLLLVAMVGAVVLTRDK